MRLTEPGADEEQDQNNRSEAEESKREHRGAPSLIGNQECAGQERGIEATNTVAKIDRANGGATVLDKITCREGKHGGRQHGHANARCSQAEQHGPKTGGDGGECRSPGEYCDSQQQDGLAGETRQQITGGQSSYSQAQGKDCGEKTDCR